MQASHKYSRFAQNLRALRLADGHSQRKLAAILGLPSSRLSRIENGSSKALEPYVIGRIVEYFEVTTDEFLAGDLVDTKSTVEREREKIAKRLSPQYVDSYINDYMATRNERLASGLYQSYVS